MKDFKYEVYVRLDENNVIKEINSSIFLKDTEGWVEIDEGMGDKYAHAQNHYLDKPIIDENGNYNYKLVDGKPVELTAEEKEILFPKAAPQPTTDERLEALESAMLEMILGGME